MFLFLKKYKLAISYFNKNIAILKELNFQHKVLETHFIIAYTYLLIDEKEKALHYLYNYFEPKEALEKSEKLKFSFKTHLRIYHVMLANNEVESQKILHILYKRLQKQAQKISDADLKHSFLHKVAVNKEILDLYEGYLTKK